jgi:ParB family chromosome partitioning protein
MIIAGERRWRASKIAGLKEVPCIEMDVDEGAIAEIALIENLQRKDLTPWEEADGLAALCEKYGYTHDDVAKKVGKSRTTITEALAIASLPEVIREQCRRADINAKSTLLEIARQPDDGSMHHLLSEITRNGLSREDIRSVRRSKQGTGGQKKSMTPERFTYSATNGDFKVEVIFKKREAGQRDIQSALQEAIDSVGEESTGASRSV